MNSIIEFWNKRAKLGETAGTDDYPLKALELRAICDNIDQGTVLDIGCGNGRTLVELAKKGHMGTGIDFSEEMIKYANSLRKEQGLENEISFSCMSIPGLEKLSTFDNIITERCLINLKSEIQHKAFVEIMEHLKPGGKYLMVESFCGGLKNTNKLRVKLGLEKILPPWHNYFLNENEIDKWQTSEYQILEKIPFASTYYFLSRVINGKIAQLHDREPQYDDEINRISLQLPIIGNFGAVQLWVWKRL